MPSHMYNRMCVNKCMFCSSPVSWVLFRKWNESDESRHTPDCFVGATGPRSHAAATHECVRLSPIPFIEWMNAYQQRCSFFSFGLHPSVSMWNRYTSWWANMGVVINHVVLSPTLSTLCFSVMLTLATPYVSSILLKRPVVWLWTLSCTDVRASLTLNGTHYLCIKWTPPPPATPMTEHDGLIQGGG